MNATRRYWLLAWWFVALLFTALGGIFYHLESRHAWDQATANLQAIARLKVSQIEEWRKERLGEGLDITERGLLGDRIREWKENPTQDRPRGILALFSRLKKIDHYRDILLVDVDGSVIFSLNSPLDPPDPKSAGDLETALRENRPVITDVYMGNDGEAPGIDVIAPVYANVDDATVPVGAVILQSDANQFLFPLIQSWPLPSKSAESVLVRREGDEVLFLNELRHQSGSSMKVRIPLTTANIPAVMAVAGERGVVEGKDYRGIDVLAAIEPVLNSPWILIAKIDKAEVFAEWRFHSLFILGTLLGLVTVPGILIAFLWQRSSRRYFQAMYRSEVQLRESEERFRTTLMSVGDGVVATDPQGRVEFLNPMAERMTGWTQEEAVERPLDEVFHTCNEVTHRNQKNPVPQVLKEGKAIELEDHSLLVSREGIEYPVTTSGAPIRDNEGTTTGVVLVFRDQSELRRHESALEASLERYYHALDEILEGCQIIGFDWKYLYVNHAVAHQAYRLREELIGLTMMEAFPGIEETPLFEVLRTCMTMREPRVLENEFTAPNGPSHWYKLSIQPAPEGLFILSIDITERKLAERQMLESQKRLLDQQKTLAALIKDEDFWGEDLEGSVQYLLEVAASHQDVERVSLWRFTADRTSMRCSDLYERTPNRHSSGTEIQCSDAPSYFEGLASVEAIVADDAETHPLTRGFREIYLEPLGIASMLDVPIRLRGVLEGVLCFEQVGEKVTWQPEQRVFAQAIAYLVSLSLEQHERRQVQEEKERLQQQLLQSQKLEAVGRLAGGVAHDFNNMLQAMLGYAELALETMDDENPYRKDLLEIRQAAKRSSNLTRQLLAFARKQTISPQVLDLDDTISNLLKMLRRLIGEDIELAWTPGLDTWKVKIDPTQIDQVLANLMVNARDAISGVGKVAIESGNVECDEDYCRNHPESIPGEYVRISVSDDGCGMDPETQEHVFEPFFTTKPVGQGTGLGLATVYGIVKQNNGFINLYSEPGEGTTFSIYLPRWETQEGDATTEETRSPIRGGMETVLLLEDEDAVLRLSERMLRGLGYTVLSTGTPDEAIRLAEEGESKIDLLITDVVMPGMNGRELSDRIATILPEVKVLFMSGYTADLIANRGVVEGGIHFIQKPFSLEGIAAKVREALDG